jgi:SAM-dependent methyltransferase
MGFDLQAVRYIFEAKRTGVDFTDTLTLGRQNLHIDPVTYRRESARFGLPAQEEAFAALPFAEGLLTTLGAKHPDSLDVSHYEGATHLADMNLPLPNGLPAGFSLVIDGGTLEHVFDFRQATINVGQLLKIGGHFISITCANNFLGHGFYQFSPELFYRVFSAENGFEVESLILTEVNSDGAWYEVADPAKIRSRVTLVNGARTYMMMRARKTADVEMFREIPQQSDYHDARWQEAPGTVEGTEFLEGSRLQRLVEARFPRPARHILRRLKQGLTDHFASPHLRKVRSF